MTEVSGASEALISEPFGKKSVQSPLHIRLSQQKRSPVKAQQLLSEMENAVANKQVRCRPFHLAGYRTAGGGRGEFVPLAGTNTCATRAAARGRESGGAAVRQAGRERGREGSRGSREKEMHPASAGKGS
jgi:hypothetical protein